MHLVFLNQYYPPDAAPTGVMLAAVAEELAAQGHEVTVICAEGGYAGGYAFTQASCLSPTARGGNGPQTKKEDPPGGGPASRDEVGCLRKGTPTGDEVGRMRKSDPTMLRIRATRFGRGTFLGKVVDYLSYYVGVAWKLMWLRPRPERIVALTTPPFLSVLARVFSKLRGGDHAHWVMDLYPDVMVAHGMLREGSAAHRLLAGLARWGFGGKRRAALLTLGPDMAERIAALVGTGFRIGPTCRQRREMNMKSDPAVAGPASGFAMLRSDKAPDEVEHLRQDTPTRDVAGRPGPSDPTWVPLWGGGHPPSTIHDPRSLRHARGWRDDELVVMYSGNMGLGHRFGEIMEMIGKEAGGRNQETGVRRQGSEVGGQRVGNVAAVCDRRSESEAEHLPSTILDLQSPITDHSPRFVFFGGGKRRGEIERFVAEHPEAAVELHDYAPAEELGMHLRSADVHLASLAAEWTGTMVPSKLQGIFHAARPVIFIGDAQSSIGRWVAESGGGWVVAPGDVEGLQRALLEARDPELRESRGRAAKAFAEANFDKQTNVRQVAAELTCALV